MATFAEILADVYSLTARPDLVAETTLAVKAATLKAHQTDFYPKDILEQAISFETPDYVHSIEYRSIIPNWRALKYLRKYDAVSGAASDFVIMSTPELVLDQYGSQRTDIVYLAGAELQVKSSTQDQYFLLGCYVNPIVTPDKYNSWVALDHPYAIVYGAAAIVLKAIGFDETASRMQQETMEQYASLRQNNLLINGW